MSSSKGQPQHSVATLPVGWRRLRLTELTERISVGLAMSVTQHYRESGVPLIRNQNICDGWFDDDDIVYVDARFAESQPGKTIRAGDVLTVRTGANIGQTCVVPSRFSGSQSFTTLITTTRSEELLPGYLSFHIQSPLGRSEIERLQVGGGKGNLNSGHLEGYRIDVPSLGEQRLICQLLASWDRAVHGLPKLIDTKIRFKQGLMQQLLSGKRCFSGFSPSTFTEHSIGDILTEANRPVVWDDKELYRLASIRRHSGGLFWREALYGSQIKVKKLHTLRGGDFLISHIQAAYGAMGLVPLEFEGGSVSEMYSILIPRNSNSLDMRYVDYLSQLKRMRHQAYLASNGFFAERLRLNFDPVEFLKHKILLPGSLDEQRRICDFLDSLVMEIQILGKQLEALKQQKKGLMQKLLTGEVRVKLPEEVA